MTSLKGKVIIVTGAGQRLGFKITQFLLQNGAFVIAVYRSEAQELRSWISEGGDTSQKVVLCKMDITENLEPLHLILKGIKAPLWGLVNCAATFVQGNLRDVGAFEKQLQVNTLAPLHLCALFSEHVNEGVVVNIIDGNITRLNPSYQSYRVSKLFLSELTRQLAFTYQGQLRVNALAPGTVIAPEQQDESYKKAVELAPTGKPPTVESVLDALLFLLQNNDITGEILAVDGGVHIL